MKILYVANERSATQPVAAALRTLAPDVSLTWARDLSSALSWVHYNRDVAALVVEAELQKQSSASFIDHVRSLGLAAPVIVISQAGAPVLALKAGADDYVANDQSLATNLTSVVARALQRAQAIAHPSGKTALRLLYVGDAALARRCLENSRWAIELSEAERASDGTFQPIPPEAAADGALPFDILLVDHDHPGVDTFAILKEIARRSLNVRVILVVEWDEKLAVPALKLGASDYVVKAADPFRALFCKLDPTRADVPLLSRRSTLVAEETVSREHLEGQVREALAAAHETQRRFDTAAAHFRERESRLLAAIEEERDTRKTLEARLERQRLDAAGVAEAGRIRSTLEAQLAEAKGALAQAEQQRALAAADAADNLAKRSAEFRATFAQALRAREAFKQQLSERTAELEAAKGALASEASSTATRLAQREEELGTQIREAVVARKGLEQRVAELEATLEQFEQRRTLDAAASAARLTKRDAELTASLAQAARSRDALEQQLREATEALAKARQERASESAAAADRLARREAELGATISEVTAARQALETQLTETEALRAQDAATRKVLEQALADADADRQATAERHASEIATARDQLAKRQALHDSALSEAATAAADQLSRREAELGATIAETVTTRDALVQKLADAAAALMAASEHAAAERAAAEVARQQAEQRHTSELSTAATLVTERQAQYDARLAEADLARGALEQRVRDVTSALEESRQQLADAHAALAESGEDRAALHESLGRTTEQFQQLFDAHDEARQIHERDRAASEAEHRRLSAEYASLQETFAGLRTQFEALERVSAEHAAERARLDGVVTEREAQLREQGATHQASQQAANQAMSLIEEKLRQALEASGREAVRFQNELSALGQELDVTRRDRDSLRTQADRLPQLQSERDESHADNRRLFEHSPFGQFRCNRDGTLKRINRAFVGLVGYRTGDELQKVDCAKTVFESEDDLHWLIERCLNSGTAETVETTWRKKDGHRIVVKLTGVAASPDTIDIVAEDITESRELEERLRQAHRMEAVGRLASEVAVTCDNLLRDVSQDGQQWLAAMHDDTVLRRRGELLLGEVTRAASFLRQLSVYGHKQTTLGPVNLQRVLHDLGPVLKSVAGDDIELVLPKASPAVNVDVESERVERVLVNVASYARERMPHGGRLNIELATVVVDRRFVAKYPNVRPGDHVLITVTEVTDTVTTSLPAALPDDGTAAASRSTIEKPGVDLGALLSLVGDCGGHLWMSAEPPGNMVLKIHLPRLASDGQQIPHTPVARLDRGRSKARWFRN